MEERRRSTCVFVGEHASAWQVWAERARQDFENFSLFVQWPGERHDSFARRTIQQLGAKPQAPATLYLACSDRSDPAAIAARGRIVKALLGRQVAPSRIELVVDGGRKGLPPTWALSLVDHLGEQSPATAVTLHVAQASRAA